MILPSELYLYALLPDYLLFGDMKTVVEEMMRKQPGNDEVKQVLVLVNSRLSRCCNVVFLISRR